METQSPEQQGYVAYHNGKDVDTDNPYSLQTHPDHHCDWEDGWIDAMKDDYRRASPVTTKEMFGVIFAVLSVLLVVAITVAAIVGML